jgi:hypothetical protein
MNRHFSTRAQARARWFSDLTDALDHAQNLLSQLAGEGAEPVEVERINRRLVDIRAELLRLNRVSLADNRIVGAAWPDVRPVQTPAGSSPPPANGSK